MRSCLIRNLFAARRRFCLWRGRRLIRAGVAVGGVHNRAGVVVIVHKFHVGRGELQDEAVHDFQVVIQSRKF